MQCKLVAQESNLIWALKAHIVKKRRQLVDEKKKKSERRDFSTVGI